MTERDDQSIDHELSGVAMAALQEHESTVSSDETEAALAAVRSRIAAGDLGGAPPSIPLVRAGGGRRSPWVRFGAVAAAVSMVALGLVAVVGGGASNDIVTPGTTPQTLDPDVAGSSVVTTLSEPAPTVDPDVESPPTGPDLATTVATPPEPSPEFVEQTIRVDAAEPPSLVEPVVWQRVPIAAANVQQVVSVAVSADTVIVKQQGVQQVSLLGPGADMSSTVDIAEDVDHIVAGPGPVFYGLGEPVFADDNPVAPRGFRFVAIASRGPNEGDVVASVEVDPNRYLQLPSDAFGEGPDGIVDRVRDVGATIIDYVDETGAPLELGAATEDAASDVPPIIPRFDDVDGDGFPDLGQRIVTPSNGRAWTLDIRRDPDNGSTFTGPSAPRPTSGGRVIYTERIGAAFDDGDFASSAMPVVAILEPDGSGQWIRLPDDWDVVASDLDGTVLMRVTDTDFEFAFLDDALAASGVVEPAEVNSTPDPVTTVPDNGLVQPTAIADNCLTDVGCTQLASTESGRIVALDWTAAAIRIYDATGTELQSEIDIAESTDPANFQPLLVAVGPDDVAYVQIVPTNATEPSADLLAIPLVGANAGSVVMRWTDLAANGDSTLISRKAGVTLVGCCGPRVTRPEPGATIYRWVDRNGDVIESTAPSFDLNLGDAGNSLTRIDTQPDGSAAFTRFTLPTALQYPRDFPMVIPTDDGGALATDITLAEQSRAAVVVDFDTDWPTNGVANSDVYYMSLADAGGIALLEATGTVLTRADGGFVRRELAEVATRGWPGEHRLLDDATTIRADGLNDYIDAEAPIWAGDPTLFGYQFVQSVGPNERVDVIVEGGDAPVLSIETTGLLDDSVAATQHRIVTERGDDGLLRFVSGTYGFRCQEGRGHQDFSTEPCI